MWTCGSAFYLCSSLTSLAGYLHSTTSRMSWRSTSISRGRSGRRKWNRTLISMSSLGRGSRTISRNIRTCSDHFIFLLCPVFSNLMAYFIIVVDGCDVGPLEIPWNSTWLEEWPPQGKEKTQLALPVPLPPHSHRKWPSRISWLLTVCTRFPLQLQLPSYASFPRYVQSSLRTPTCKLGNFGAWAGLNRSFQDGWKTWNHH